MYKIGDVLLKKKNCKICDQRNRQKQKYVYVRIIFKYYKAMQVLLYYD